MVQNDALFRRASDSGIAPMVTLPLNNVATDDMSFFDDRHSPRRKRQPIPRGVEEHEQQNSVETTTSDLKYVSKATN